MEAFEQKKSITLPRAGGTQQQAKFVCVNGRTYQVPCGQPVQVPLPVYEVLETALRQEKQARQTEQALAAD